MLISAATEVALPAAAKPFLDGTFVHKDPVLMRWIPWLIVVLFAVRGIGTFLGQYASSWVATRVIMDLRQQMFGKLLALPLGYFADNLSGKLISKFTFDVIQVAVAVTYVVTVLVRDSVTIVALARLSAVAELEADADHVRDDSAHRDRRPRLQPAPARAHAPNPAGHGRCQPCAAGKHRGPEGGQDLRRTSLREARVSARRSTACAGC